MAETADAARIKKRVLADYKKGKKPKELSEKYGVSVNTIKSWIRRANAPPKEGAPERVRKDAPRRGRGAPAGNTNAVGNRGGGAPFGNTNALIHGGYSPVYWDTLTAEERALLDGVTNDCEQLLVEEIFLLSVRERRIMARIQKYAETKGGQLVAGVIRSEDKREFKGDHALEEKALYEERQAAKVQSGDILPGHKYSLTTRTEAAYDVVHRLEEALTRCQAQKQRCIQNLAELRRKDSGGGGEISVETRSEVEEMIRYVGRDQDGGGSSPDESSG